MNNVTITLSIPWRIYRRRKQQLLLILCLIDVPQAQGQYTFNLSRCMCTALPLIHDGTSSGCRRYHERAVPSTRYHETEYRLYFVFFEIRVGCCVIFNVLWPWTCTINAFIREVYYTGRCNQCRSSSVPRLSFEFWTTCMPILSLLEQSMFYIALKLVLCFSARKL
jgi:hypothetical protein